MAAGIGETVKPGRFEFRQNPIACSSKLARFRRAVRHARRDRVEGEAGDSYKPLIAWAVVAKCRLGRRRCFAPSVQSGNARRTPGESIRGSRKYPDTVVGREVGDGIRRGVF
jgi:hypothetical protein